MYEVVKKKNSSYSRQQFITNKLTSIIKIQSILKFIIKLLTKVIFVFEILAITILSLIIVDFSTHFAIFLYLSNLI